MNDFRKNNSQRGGFRNEQTQKESPDDVFKSAGYNPVWIRQETDKDLIRFAETTGEYMAKNGLTNSKIRSIYGEIKRIQMGEFEKEKAAFYLLRPKVAYALGRDSYNKGLKLFKKIFDECAEEVTNQKTFLNFCNLLEAILAYHKAYGGKD